MFFLVFRLIKATHAGEASRLLQGFSQSILQKKVNVLDCFGYTQRHPSFTPSALLFSLW